MNRRAFLKSAGGGLLFVGCGRTASAAQTNPARRHAPVTIRGRRIRTIDVHAHCTVQRARDLLHRQVNRQADLMLQGTALAERLAAMDRQGIDLAVLSVVPDWYDAERDLAAEVVRVQNDAIAEFCSAHRDRFAGLATIAMQFPDLAVAQLEHAVRDLGLRGAAVATNVAGLELADRKFDPVWAKAEALGVVVFIHPIDTADPARRLAGAGALGKVIGHPYETTVALSHLIFEGTLDRFPGLKICASHGGGYLPSYMSRSDYGCGVFPDQCTAGVPAKRPSDYLKRMYFDSLVFTPEGLRHLAAEAGAGQIVMGTDFPYPWTDRPVDHILETPGLTDADREAMLGGTAAKLLKL